jgi:hypothetical protein
MTDQEADPELGGAMDVVPPPPFWRLRIAYTPRSWGSSGLRPP